MKLFKKIISVASAVAMIAAVTSSMMIVQAAPLAPTLKGTLVNYDETAKTGTIKFTLENLKGDTDANVDSLSLYSLGVGLMFDPAQFDASLYKTTGRPKPIDTNFTVGSLVSTGAQRGYNASGRLGLNWAATPSTGVSTMESATVFDSLDLCTVNFKLVADSATITITDTESRVAVQTDDWDDNPSANYIYGTSNSSTANWNYDLPEIGGVEFVVPTNDSDSADSSAILNVKPSDIGGEGDVWANEDGSENAVAGLANFTPSAATSTIEWTISATPVGGEATEYTKAFDLGASIDAAATIGLIVNYNTAEYSSVSIVSGALK